MGRIWDSTCYAEFCWFQFAFKKQQKNICAKVKNSESTVLVLLGGWISVISTLEGRIGLNHKCLFPGQPVSKTAFRSLTNTTIPVDLFSGWKRVGNSRKAVWFRFPLSCMFVLCFFQSPTHSASEKHSYGNINRNEEKIIWFLIKI